MARRFAGLGGLDALKAFLPAALRPVNRPGRPRPRGILMLGVPGTGKSAFCKALGHETGRPTVILDVGALKGSLVGQTEERTRRALAQIDQMAPCICMVDEIEKALAGVQASGQTDSGVTAGLFGTLLSWLNDHESDVFFVATCNDIRKLPPEFSRSERVRRNLLPGPARPGPEGCDLADLPGPLWAGSRSQRRPRDLDWTGAEIKACCRLAALLDQTLA